MTVDLLVNGKQFAMEVDTGAAVSIISEATYKSFFTDSKLQKCDVVLRTYTDERMTVLSSSWCRLHTGSNASNCA